MYSNLLILWKYWRFIFSRRCILIILTFIFKLKTNMAICVIIIIIILINLLTFINIMADRILKFLFQFFGLFLHLLLFFFNYYFISWKETINISLIYLRFQDWVIYCIFLVIIRLSFLFAKFFHLCTDHGTLNTE